MTNRKRPTKPHHALDPEELSIGRSDKQRAYIRRLANERLAAAAVKIEGDHFGWPEGKRQFRKIALTAALNQIDGVSLEGVEYGQK